MRYGKNLGFEQPFLAKILPRLVEFMGEEYPELVKSQDRIAEILTVEEENFLRTLKKGGNILHSIIEKAEKSAHRQITGEDAFKLKDTYGFPIEEVLLIAKDMDLEVNLESYQLLEEKAKERSRQAMGFKSQDIEKNIFQEFAQKHPSTEFTGYDTDYCEATVIGALVSGEFVEKIESGQKAVIILDKTPFYAEKGGQIGDNGEITHQGAKFEVNDTKEPFTGVIAHYGQLTSGTLLVGEPVLAGIDQIERRKTERAHTATHLLDYALLQILGQHVKQAGSLVEPGRLRFDFTHHKPMSDKEVRQVEIIINEKIRQDAIVNTYTLSYDDVQKRSDIVQEFGEKYGKIVRVVDIGGFSKELCGGTHSARTGIIGLVRISKESSIGAGIRRLEVFCGKEAENYMYRQEDRLKKVCELLSSSAEQSEERLRSLMEENQALKSQVKKMREGHLHNIVAHLLNRIDSIDQKNTAVLTAAVDVEKNELIPLSQQLLKKIQSGALLLTQEKEGRVQILIRVTPNLIQNGIFANQLMQEIAPIVDGKGGGGKDLAQAGGKNPQKLSEAYQAFKKRIQELC
jgi:alanyl-tRNA synthetase